MIACENTLIRASACHYHWSGAAGYSLKRFSSGNAYYRFDGLRRRVDPSHFLLLNVGQPYELDIDSSVPVASHCLFFSTQLVQDIFCDLTTAETSKLDSPDGHSSAMFVPRLYLLDDELLLRLRAFESQELDGQDSSPMLREERFRLLAVKLVERSLARARAECRIKALKSSTREEVYRRVGNARDVIISHWEKPLRLEEIARASSLSPNHLLRSFRAVYRTTPGRFQQSLRMNAAARKLISSKLSVARVAGDCGFKSVTSFSQLFRRYFGMSPRDYRKR